MIGIISLLEDLVAERYASKFKRPFYVVRGNFKDYDVASLSGDILIEVKFDSKSISTGNFAIEYSYRGEPSGIKATKADYFVLIVPRGKELVCHEVDVRTLLSVLESMYLVTGGDGDRSMMKLLPVSYLPQISSDTFILKIDQSHFEKYWEQKENGNSNEKARE